jgi:outer membrane protein insertion porin family
MSIRQSHIVFFALFCAFAALPTLAQAQRDSSIIEVDYNSPKDYEVGSVKVVGAKFSDENAIINIAGLKVGQKLRVPSGTIPRAIKALWRLHLFTDIQINITKKIGEVVFLEIAVKEHPRLTRFDFVGVKSSNTDDLKKAVRPFLLKGGIVTEDVLTNASNAVKEHYVEKGYLDTEVNIKQIQEPGLENGVRLEISIDKNDRVKIQDIVFEGNKNASSKKLRKQMDKTRRKRRLFASSKLVDEEYEADKKKLIDYYNTIGFRDAKILGDSLWRNAKGDVLVKIKVDEGARYFFRNISWKGNSIYTDDVLSQVLGISKGDVYDSELLQKRLSFSQDNRDVSSLYLDNGYLFFRVDPVEKAIVKDSIDLELRIFEGPLATIDRVIITGNDRTHEHVIRRELRTKPGEKFSRADIIRSQREVVSLGYFNPETLGINPVPNPQRGTVDIEYKLEEKSSDQLELSAGWGGGRVIGTLGVTFNNFSLRNIFNKEAWHPLPQGDGQRLSIRGQTNGKYYQSYNLSFTEPWLGGKKPTSFTVGSFFSLISNGYDRATTNYASIATLGGSVSLGTRLKRPDDFFVFNGALNLQSYKLNNWSSANGSFVVTNPRFERVTDGRFNNFNLSLTLSRNSINNPIFPQSGSRISLTGQFTPPYSLFKSELSDSLGLRFKWVEYHKWRFNAEWYAPVFNKLVFKASAKIGMLGYYNRKLGTSPFERFALGGDGISNQFNGIVGRDIISMRGYEEPDIEGNYITLEGQTENNGASVFDKFTFELRYPISLNPNSTVYLLTFFEGGNAWNSFRDFNPFEMKRSAGLGLRVFLPMFGTLGFDYGFGFDKPNATGNTLTDKYGNFNIILGFEPE